MPLDLNILVGALAVGSVGISGIYAIEKFALRDRPKPRKGQLEGESASGAQEGSSGVSTQQQGSSQAAAAA